MATKEAFKAARVALHERFQKSGLPAAFKVPDGELYCIHNSNKVSYSGNVYAFTGPSVSTIDNWSKCIITIGKYNFTASEQVIFAAGKAALFNDQKSFQAAVSNPNMTPAAAKKLGRGVANFNDKIWKESMLWISDIALTIKCLQNDYVLEELLKTRGKLICEASQKDLLWGIGATADNVEIALVPENWRGKNELGKSLMRVREELLLWIEGESMSENTVADDNIDKFYSCPKLFSRVCKAPTVLVPRMESAEQFTANESRLWPWTLTGIVAQEKFENAKSGADSNSSKASNSTANSTANSNSNSFASTLDNQAPNLKRFKVVENESLNARESVVVLSDDSDSSFSKGLNNDKGLPRISDSKVNMLALESKFRHSGNTLNLKTGKVLAQATRIDSPVIWNDDTRVDCARELFSTSPVPLPLTPSPEPHSTEPFVLYMDPTHAPHFFTSQMPSNLNGKLAISTYAARIQELNQVIVNSQATLVDYTPVYRLTSLVFLVTWTSLVSIFVALRITASSVAPWAGLDTVGIIFGVFITAISILFVRWSFERQPLQYLEHLRCLLRKYTLIDAHNGLIWQLHASIRYPIPKVITSFDSKQAYVQKLHHSGVVDQEQNQLLPRFQFTPTKPVVWLSIEQQEFELIVSRGSFLMRPPSKAQRRQDTTTTNATTLRNIERIGVLGGVDDGMIVLEMEPEMEFVKEWADGLVVVPGADVRPVSLFCESILENESCVDGFEGVRAVDSGSEDEEEFDGR
ncbi:UNVERIFIED_CONTAM: hypothetical protein HDU68_012873 [Siphonaria sp. JEL0065]|nr:hypothetical protein HDU68_012873 [Siphonaria sp. JEL0065]